MGDFFPVSLSLSLFQVIASLDERIAETHETRDADT
jgi:hypothetical protein